MAKYASTLLGIDSLRLNDYTQAARFLKAMVLRELRMRYAGSVMGILWAVIHPLIMITVFSFVFALVLRIRLNLQVHGTTNFTLWMVAGLLPWFAFSEAVTSGCFSLCSNAHLIKRIRIHAELIPLTYVISVFIHHTVAFTILAVISAIKGYLYPTLFFVPLFMGILFLIALGIALITAALHVFIRDVGQLLGALLHVWFYATPIIYPIDFIPIAFLRKLMSLNPIYWVIQGYRQCLFGQGMLPITPFFLLVIFSFGLAICGELFFKKLKPAFADVL